MVPVAVGAAVAYFLNAPLGGFAFGFRTALALIVSLALQVAGVAPRGRIHVGEGDHDRSGEPAHRRSIRRSATIRPRDPGPVLALARQLRYLPGAVSRRHRQLGLNFRGHEEYEQRGDAAAVRGFVADVAPWLRVVPVDGPLCTALGVRVPIGIAFDFNNVPLDIFVEGALVVDTFLDYDGDYNRADFNVAVGFRYWF